MSELYSRQFYIYCNMLMFHNTFQRCTENQCVSTIFFNMIAEGTQQNMTSDFMVSYSWTRRTKENTFKLKALLLVVLAVVVDDDDDDDGDHMTGVLL